jgi:hypothetical protein
MNAVTFLAILLSAPPPGCAAASGPPAERTQAPYSTTVDGLRASVSEPRVREGVLTFRCELRWTESRPFSSSFVFFRLRAWLAVTFYDADKKPLYTTPFPFGRPSGLCIFIDKKFGDREKDVMSTLATIPVPRSAKFFKAELRMGGDGLKSPIIKLPEAYGRTRNKPPAAKLPIPAAVSSTP